MGGSVQLPAAAASGVRHIQELRGPVARGFHGWQRRGDAWQGDLVRAQGGGQRRWQEEVSASCGRVLRHAEPPEFPISWLVSGCPLLECARCRLAFGHRQPSAEVLSSQTLRCWVPDLTGVLREFLAQPYR